MFIAHTVGREIPAENAGRRRSPLPAILVLLDILAIGILGGLLIGNRLLTAQLAIYGEANMAASSVVLDLMDDFFKPLVYAISTVLLLTTLTIGAWLLAGIRILTWRRFAIGLLVLLIALNALWFGLGRRSAGPGTPPPMTPTPVVSVPDL